MLRCLLGNRRVCHILNGLQLLSTLSSGHLCHSLKRLCMLLWQRQLPNGLSGPLLLLHPLSSRQTLNHVRLLCTLWKL